MKSPKRSDLQFLKFFVYMLGFVLVFATIFLTYVAYKKNIGDIVTQNTDNHKCTQVNITVAGKIQNITHENGNIYVLWRKDQGVFAMSIYDQCNGNVVNEFDIKQNPNEKIEEPKEEPSLEQENNILS